MVNHSRFRNGATYRAFVMFGTLSLVLVGWESNGQTAVQLTVSNKLKSGVVYATVTLSQQPGTDTVSFLVTADPNVYTPHATAANFGIASFGFESSVPLDQSGADITFDPPTSSWAVKQPGGSEPGFSTFDWVLQANNGATLASKTLAFHVTHTGITPATFTSKVNGQNADFAAQIINFPKTSGVTSDTVANTGAHVQHALVFVVSIGIAIFVAVTALFLVLWKFLKVGILGKKRLQTA